ncbi:MAG: hypothetical protein QOC73_667, partial [Actinomycetota bacterium]|nr:hypothetical protein [Actinomycetota bacterium]
MSETQDWPNRDLWGQPTQSPVRPLKTRGPGAHRNYSGRLSGVDQSDDDSLYSPCNTELTVSDDASTAASKSGGHVKHGSDARQRIGARTGTSVDALIPGATWARARRSAFVGVVSCAAAVGMLPLAGVADASTARTPQPVTVSANGAYIVQSAAGHISQAKHDVVALGGTIGVDLPIINGFGA